MSDEEEYARFLRWCGDFPDYVALVRLQSARKMRDWYEEWIRGAICGEVSMVNPPDDYKLAEIVGEE
jgi:hypothetical protein